MVLRVVRTPRARHDLIEIWSYIADDNEGAADRVLDRFDQLLTLLADNPLAGRARPDLGDDDIRSMPSGNYVLFYQVTGTDLLLVRVLNGFRDIGPDDFEGQ